jgi:hypothetical protein
MSSDRHRRLPVPARRLLALAVVIAAAVSAAATPAVAATTPSFSASATQPQTTGAIADWASLQGAAPTGTITFVLYGPNNSTCSGSPAFTSVKTVTGNGAYMSDWYTPTAPGTYQWVAVYSGDANNTPMSTSCADPANAVTIGGNLAAVAAAPSSVHPGATLAVSWSGIQHPTSTDWLGLFAVGAPSSAERSWRYTGGTSSGSTTLPVPWGTPPGSYEVRLLYNNSMVLMARSNVVTVS